MNILYITYNGLTDFIGQAQVMPYLIESARAGARITVISFESADRHAKLGEMTAAICEDAGICWLPQRFRTRPPLAAKWLDQRTMFSVAQRVAKEENFDIVHCRSYTAAWVGLSIKRAFGTPLLFDMRGFWPDSRRDGGRWPAGNPFYAALFKRWKRHENELLGAADHIISLTKAARDTLVRWPGYNGAPVSIIPCCNDFELFRPNSPEEDLATRRRIGIDANAPVVLYLGTLGSIYMLGEKIALFERIRRRHPDAVMLFVGRYGMDEIMAEAQRCGVKAPPREAFRCTSGERKDMPALISIADVGLCFYVQAVSSKAVSPTKLGEYLACGVPAFANAIVGDTAEILRLTGGGHSLPDLDGKSLDRAADQFDTLLAADRAAIREAARPILDLPNAARLYQAIYADMKHAHVAF